MNDHPASGNRWEPDAADAHPAPSPEAQIRAGTTASVPTADADGAAARDPWQARVRRQLTTGRLKVAAAALVIFLAGGAAGYGVAHARPDEAGTGVPGQGPFGRDGHGHGPGGPQDGPRGPGSQDGTGSPGSGT